MEGKQYQSSVSQPLGITGPKKLGTGAAQPKDHQMGTSYAMNLSFEFDLWCVHCMEVRACVHA